MIKEKSQRKARFREVKQKEPDFINRIELAHHLQCSTDALDDFIENGTVPRPHARPGERHAIWRRDHYLIFKETGHWPREAFTPSPRA